MGVLFLLWTLSWLMLLHKEIKSQLTQVQCTHRDLPAALKLCLTVRNTVSHFEKKVCIILPFG